MNYIHKLPNYVRNGVYAVSLCALLAGCTTKPKIRSEPVAPTTGNAALQMPEVKQEPTYIILEEPESKTPVKPIKQKTKVRKKILPLETTVSNTPMTTSQNTDNQQIPYGAIGAAAGGLILTALMVYAMFRRKEDNQQQDS